MIPATGVPAIDWFLGLLDNWGYAVVFGFTVFENLFVVGSFTPGETAVVAASFLAARKLLFISGVWVSSLLGTLIGSNVSYWLGRRAGLEGVRAFVERAAATRTGRFLRIHSDAVDEVHDHFHADGAKTVLLARFAVGVKNFVPTVAGATRMPFAWFELYTALGAILYTTAMCLVGWFLGDNLDAAVVVIRRVGFVGLMLFAAFIFSAVWARRRIRARRLAKAAGEADTQSAKGEEGEADVDA